MRIKTLLTIILIAVCYTIFGKTEPLFTSIGKYTGNQFTSDAFGYTRVSTLEGDSLSFKWIDITNSGTSLNLSDDSYVSLPLSFQFPFYDSHYQSIDVQSNGSITFHGSYFGYSNASLPTNAYSGPWDGVYMLWTDLDPGSGEIYFQDYDSFCVIQYNNVNYFASSIPLTFEMILQDNGDIYMLYKDISYIDGTIGMQSSSAFTSGNGYYDEYIYDGIPNDHTPVDSSVVLYQYPNYDWDSNITGISMDGELKPGETVYPVISIRNIGNNPMILDISLCIDSSSLTIYSDADMLMVDVYETVSCTLNSWTTGPENHTVYNAIGSIFNPMDENPVNDTLSYEILTEELFWERCADRRTGEHCQATAYDSEGEVFYSFGGYHKNGVMTDAVYIYNPLTDAWSTKNPMPQELYWIDASYAHGNMYILGGHDDVQALDIALIYDISEDSFRYGPAIIHEILGPSIVTYKDSLLYCLGGRSGSGLSTNYVQIYDAYRDTVLSGTPINKSIMRGGAAITDSIIWIIGGQYTDSLYYGIINTGNPTNIDWHQGSLLPANTWANGAGTMKRDDKWYLYLIGGYQNSSISDNVWEYDIEDDVWTFLPDYPMNLTRNDFAAVSSELGMIFVSGGDSTGNLDEAKQSWKLQWPDITGIDNAYLDNGMNNTSITSQFIVSGISRIFFSIEEEANVSMDVYNSGGRHIVNLMKEHISPNEYSLLWDMKDDDDRPVPAGLYFIRLSVNRNTETGRIIYIK